MSDEWQEVAKEFGWHRFDDWAQDPIKNSLIVERMAEEIIALRKQIRKLVLGFNVSEHYGAAETGRLCFSALEDWRIYSEKLLKALDEASQELWIQGVPRSIREALDLPRPGDP